LSWKPSCASFTIFEVAHKALQEKEREYKQHQKEVFERSKSHHCRFEQSSEEEEVEELEDNCRRDSSPEDHFFGYLSNAPPSPPRFPSDIEPDDNSSVEREVRFKQMHSSEYFDTLDDILE